jgi:hypothetical protein
MSDQNKSNASGVVSCPPDYNDPFAPLPGSTRIVRCLHCGQSYSEDKVVYGLKPAASSMDEPLWWCPTPRCDGAGVGCDIHPEGDDASPDC